MMEDDVKVTLTVQMTPEEYVAIKKRADWQMCSVGEYLVKYATGKYDRGC